jgi:hypothetical protein
MAAPARRAGYAPLHASPSGHGVAARALAPWDEGGDCVKGPGRSEAPTATTVTDFALSATGTNGRLDRVRSSEVALIFDQPALHARCELPRNSSGQMAEEALAGRAQAMRC